MKKLYYRCCSSVPVLAFTLTVHIYSILASAYHPELFCSLYDEDTIKLIGMSYKAGITKAIDEMKDRTGSSMQAIKKHMQAEMGDKKWLNGMFLKALKDGVEKGDFIKVKASYKLSPAAKAKFAAAKKKAAPKKAATKKAAPKKKAVSV